MRHAAAAGTSARLHAAAAAVAMTASTARRSVVAVSQCRWHSSAAAASSSTAASAATPARSSSSADLYRSPLRDADDRTYAHLWQDAWSLDAARQRRTVIWLHGLAQNVADLKTMCEILAPPVRKGNKAHTALSGGARACCGGGGLGGARLGHPLTVPARAPAGHLPCLSLRRRTPRWWCHSRQSCRSRACRTRQTSAPGSTCWRRSATQRARRVASPPRRTSTASRRSDAEEDTQRDRCEWRRLLPGPRHKQPALTSPPRCGHCSAHPCSDLNR